MLARVSRLSAVISNFAQLIRSYSVYVKGKTTEKKWCSLKHARVKGKSLTMVFVARMLRVSNDLHDYKIILINDRLDLEEQLTATAQLIGDESMLLKATIRYERIGSHQHFRYQYRYTDNKFQSRRKASPYPLLKRWEPTGPVSMGKTFGVVNASSRIVI